MYLINLVILLMLLTVASVGAQEPLPAVFVNPEEVGGLTPDGYIPEGGTDLTIPVRFHNVDDARTAISNGFFFRSQGAAVENISVEWNPAYPWRIEEAAQMGCYPWEGCYAWFDYFAVETFIDRGLGGYGMAAVALFGSGLPADFNDIAYTFTLTGVSGGPGAILTMDTTYWEPGNYWLWSGVFDSVSWGGPYVFEVEGGPGCPEPYTTCWPQPIKLRIYDNDRILNVSIFCEENDEVDLASVLVFGKIPSLTNDGVAWIEGDSIVTDAFLMRFLGCGGFRPLAPDGVIGTYFVTYVKNGTEYSLEGDFVLTAIAGDVTFDGKVNLEDAIFLTEHLFGNGPGCALDGYDMDELMDVDRSGRFDLLDVRALIEMIM